MTRTDVFRIIVAGSALLALGACGGVKEQLGLTKKAPDEFRVVSRAPLSLPPDFTLRPPEPGAPRPQEGTAAQQARTAVFRAPDPQQAPANGVASGSGRSVGEEALLKAAAADQAQPGIREIVNRETKRINEEGDSFVDSLVFWRAAEKPGVVVDANAEAKRLRENAALGKEVTTGETPTIERKKKALLEGIF